MDNSSSHMGPLKDLQRPIEPFHRGLLSGKKTLKGRLLLLKLVEVANSLYEMQNK